MFCVAIFFTVKQSEFIYGSASKLAHLHAPTLIVTTTATMTTVMMMIKYEKNDQKNKIDIRSD